MRYEESICFSAVQAEALNKEAFSLDRRLFLFAYYDPKPYLANESNRSKFQTAIINLYGLFWDCGPFVSQLLYSYDSILLYDWYRIQAAADSLKNCISAFRSIFCHNNSDQFPLNEEKIFAAERWISLHINGTQGIDSLHDDDWGTLLGHLVGEADSLISDIDTALDALQDTWDLGRRERAVERWIRQIAITYQKNPDYLLNTAASMYQLYLLNTNQPLDSSRALRSLTTKWICAWISATSNTEPKNWYERWLYTPDTANSSSDDITATRLYAILKDWPNRWAAWNRCAASECEEPPMPASDFFRILAQDLDHYAHNPSQENGT